MTLPDPTQQLPNARMTSSLTLARCFLFLSIVALLVLTQSVAVMDAEAQWYESEPDYTGWCHCECSVNFQKTWEGKLCANVHGSAARDLAYQSAKDAGKGHSTCSCSCTGGPCGRTLERQREAEQRQAEQRQAEQRQAEQRQAEQRQAEQREEAQEPAKQETHKECLQGCDSKKHECFRRHCEQGLPDWFFDTDQRRSKCPHGKCAEAERWMACNRREDVLESCLYSCTDKCKEQCTAPTTCGYTNPCLHTRVCH